MVPTIVDACVRRVKALLPVGWVLIYGTLEDYETAFGINFAGDLASALREASTGYRRKVLARVKDEVQPQVLYEYGGVWLDASVVLMHPVDTFFSVLDSRLDFISLLRHVAERYQLVAALPPHARGPQLGTAAQAPAWDSRKKTATQICEPQDTTLAKATA